MMIHAKLRPVLSKLSIFCLSIIVFMILKNLFGFIIQADYIRFISPVTPVPLTQEDRDLASRMTRLAMSFNVTRRLRVLRNDSCDNCALHGYNYIVKNDQICVQRNHIAIEALFLILTQHSRKTQREVIRRTWASDSRQNKGRIRYIFLLGISKSEKENLNILKESKMHNDILIEDFMDTYENLTLKTIMGLKFATERCPNAKLVFKADDDMWVNIPALFEVANSNIDRLQTSVAGCCFRNVTPDRNTDSKWYVSEELYPKERYPDFCSGTAYMTSMNAARKIYQVSRNVPYFFLEDVYIGLCLETLGYNVTDILGFYNRNVTYSENLCDYKKKDVITVHKVTPLKIDTLWNINCDSENAYIADFFKTNTSEINENKLKLTRKSFQERY